jgi:hypothetical protein
VSVEDEEIHSGASPVGDERLSSSSSASRRCTPLTHPGGSLAGTYLAQGRQATTRHVLTLNGDLSATLRTEGLGSGGPADLRGSWILDGPSVQVSLSAGDEATTLVLTLRDGSLVVAGSGYRAALAGLVFERTAEPPPAN